MTITRRSCRYLVAAVLAAHLGISKKVSGRRDSKSTRPFPAKGGTADHRAFTPEASGRPCGVHKPSCAGTVQASRRVPAANKLFRLMPLCTARAASACGTTGMGAACGRCLTQYSGILVGKGYRRASPRWRRTAHPSWLASQLPCRRQLSVPAGRAVLTSWRCRARSPTGFGNDYGSSEVRRWWW